jgi:hypothetical protein
MNHHTSLQCDKQLLLLEWVTFLFPNKRESAPPCHPHLGSSPEETNCKRRAFINPRYGLGKMFSPLNPEIVVCVVSLEKDISRFYR